MEIWDLAQDNQYAPNDRQLENMRLIYKFIEKSTTKNKIWFRLTEISKGTGINPQQVILMVLILSVKRGDKQVLQMRTYKYFKPTFRMSIQVRLKRKIKSGPNSDTEKDVPLHPHA